MVVNLRNMFLFRYVSCVLHIWSTSLSPCIDVRVHIYWSNTPSDFQNVAHHWLSGRSSIGRWRSIFHFQHKKPPHQWKERRASLRTNCGETGRKRKEKEAEEKSWKFFFVSWKRGVKGRFLTRPSQHCLFRPPITKQTQFSQSTTRRRSFRD